MIVDYDDFRFLFRHVSASTTRVRRTTAARPFAHSPDGSPVALYSWPRNRVGAVVSAGRFRVAAGVSASPSADGGGWSGPGLRYVYLPSDSPVVFVFGETT